MASAAFAEAIVVEAEEGRLHGGAVKSSETPGFSGNGYIGGFAKPGDAVDIPVETPEAGFYTLRIRYAAPEEKMNPVLVNGSIQRNGFYPKTEGFQWITVGRVALRKGENTVTLGTDWGYILADAVEVSPAPAPMPFQVADHPVNPNASAEARELYSRLRQRFGKYVLAGQQDEKGERRAYLASIAPGYVPVVVGFDLLNSSSAYGRPDGQIEKAREWASKGGIVSFSWHWFSPFGAQNEVWRSYSTNQTTFDAGKVMDEGSPEYQAVIKDMDGIADQLKVLRDARVPVLWRPLHEAEGRWFWWGAKGPEVTKRLYRLMYERFTKVHHLDNLLWVWTTTDSPVAEQWYPGDDCVDIVGADLYAPAGVRGTYLAVFDNLRQLYRGRKMIALTEVGAMPDPDALVAEDAGWLWFLVWDDYITRADTNPVDLIRKTYSHPHVLRLDAYTSGEKEN
ncbi:mannan endo-1,4-beta-mannosidase [Terrimicrobium sacchariphilum]|uniref:Mannan endo-1,4-beta-mannosidase n=2 Tax=Terrimicrobium sacchariphilum TaxID=690879 RepID=A0A146G151_TERSA|nr:mannan endo-1,4-beta-mannosidase [Terrimicrobium sacchariphilum]